MSERTDKQKAWDKRLGERSAERALKAKHKGTPPFNGKAGRVVAKFPHRLEQGVWRLSIYNYVCTLNAQGYAYSYISAKLHNSGKCERKANYWIGATMPNARAGHKARTPRRMHSDWDLLKTIEGETLADEVFEAMKSYIKAGLHETDETLRREDKHGELSPAEYTSFLESRVASAESNLADVRALLAEHKAKLAKPDEINAGSFEDLI